MPPAMLARIRQLAESERRSLNAQLVVLLEQATSASQPKEG
jgi:hypothetical protein